MQTSGLVLDVYDDFGGGVLRELFPSFDDIPEQVKVAHVVTAEEREQLPDDVFALVLVNNGETLRKYACIDEGNTVLSVQYFLKNAHKLPLEAQKVAAENLKAACAWYDLQAPEELEKVALGVMTALTAVPVIKGTHQAISENLAATRALGGGAGNIVTPAARDAALGRKTAEVSGTVLAPNQGPGDPSAGLKGSKTVIQKTARVGHLVASSKGDQGVPPADNLATEHKEQPSALPQARQMHPTVDVSDKQPPKYMVEKKAEHFALPEQKKYPLDSYTQVKAASGYFDTYSKHMAPPTRHEYAVNLVKRASALAVAVSDNARKYGAEDFAPEAEIKAAFDVRRLEVQNDADALKLLGAVEKVARFRMWKEASAETPQVLSAAEVVDLLAEFDKVAGLDHHYDRTIPDPYFSIYGFDKSASADDPEFSEVIGNETVTEADLRRLVRIAAFTVKTTFGADFQEEFLKDPVGIFKSLPLAQKKMVMRMANGTGPGQERTYY
jgi:hypothetical protein